MSFQSCIGYFILQNRKWYCFWPYNKSQRGPNQHWTPMTLSVHVSKLHHFHFGMNCPFKLQNQFHGPFSHFWDLYKFWCLNLCFVIYSQDNYTQYSVINVYYIKKLNMKNCNTLHYKNVLFVNINYISLTINNISTAFNNLSWC